jgi:ABC-2 type transport system ATP-binding protein
LGAVAIGLPEWNTRISRVRTAGLRNLREKALDRTVLQPPRGHRLAFLAVAAIEVRQLERRFPGGVQAVAGIDLEVADGEIYAFLGPNGAGKTTTVRMLTTLLRPTGGSASVASFDIVKQAADVRRSIGVALQEAALDPLMTGRELMLLQATLHGIRKDEGTTRSTALLDRVGLTEAADRRIGTYSGGMRRRLDLATALIHAPRVLFLDEPTTGLDPVSRRAIWEEVRKLNDEGTTIFLTTQYLEEADQLADRVGIIDDGRMAAEGTPGALKAQIGMPHLEVTVADGTAASGEQVLARFGELMPARDGAIMVQLEHGAGEVAAVVRALDEAGLSVESLDLVQPSLDDVFVAKTGKHLEGAKEPEEPETTAAVER